jgi:hypothetical protein
MWVAPSRSCSINHVGVWSALFSLLDSPSCISYCSSWTTHLQSNSPSILLSIGLWESTTMAANYWESTQRRHWQFTRQQLEDLRKKLEDEDQNLVQMYTLPELRHLSIYFNQRECLLHCCASALSPGLMVLQYRDFSPGETPRRTTTGNGHGPAIHSSILFEG